MHVHTHTQMHTPTTCFCMWSEAFMATIWNKDFSGDQPCNGEVQKLSVALHHCSLCDDRVHHEYKYRVWPHYLSHQFLIKEAETISESPDAHAPFTGWLLETSLNLFLDGSSRHIYIYFSSETLNIGRVCSSSYKQFVLNFIDFCSHILWNYIFLQSKSTKKMQKSCFCDTIL